MTISDSKPRQTKVAEPRRRVGVAARAALARYNEDFARWTFEQAKLLRKGTFGRLDIENIAEELETLGRGEFNRLESILTVLVMHMLKWDYQPAKRSRSWANSIRVQRIHAARQIRDNPSLEPRRDEALADAYETARLQASTEAELPANAFPIACPYSWADVMERPFAFDSDDA